ncbi:MULTISPECIES: DUF2188 domain-containing protein [unclassified Methylobacterium]|jgi:hypothetical protein|uniref:DUF2188 domain-containing protein n=1 Tax=unclassified Methylobacterium TaxID=2615210 RepID=UPI00068A7DEC|nr:MULTISPECIES: DUF2188 domain-containing protein [unclassified Methylobacterium]SFV11835.1 hypothetical protein SAMN02799643_05577 [Methylobacterium sp. UNCCL125]
MALDLEPYWLVHGTGPTNYAHPTKASAIREAERLARENPGQAFVVLEAVEAIRLVEFERLTFGEPSEVSPGPVPGSRARRFDDIPF